MPIAVAGASTHGCAPPHQALLVGREVYAFTRSADDPAQELARSLGAVWAGIHMSDIPAFAYADLWQKRTIRSVANLTRRDGREFLELAAAVPVRTTVTAYGLPQTEDALADLRAGRFEGAAVIVP